MTSLRERLARQKRQASARTRADKLAHWRQEFRKLNVLDDRPIDQLVAYDDNGLPL